MKRKEFRTVDGKTVRAVSEDLFHIYPIGKEWTLVPEPCWSSAYSKGAISKDMNGDWNTPEENIAKIRAENILFEKQLKEKMTELIDEGDIEKIDTTGKPKISVLSDLFPDKTINRQLRDKIYKRIKR